MAVITLKRSTTSPNAKLIPLIANPYQLYNETSNEELKNLEYYINNFFRLTKIVIDKLTWIFQFRIFEWLLLAFICCKMSLVQQVFARAKDLDQNFSITFINSEDVIDFTPDIWLEPYPTSWHENLQTMFNMLPEDTQKLIYSNIESIPEVACPFVVATVPKLVFVCLIYIILLPWRRQYRVPIMYVLCILLFWEQLRILYDIIMVKIPSNQELLFANDSYIILKMIPPEEQIRIANEEIKYGLERWDYISEYPNKRLWELMHYVVTTYDYSDCFRLGECYARDLIRARIDTLIHESYDTVIIGDRELKRLANIAWRKALHDNHPMIDVFVQGAEGFKNFMQGKHGGKALVGGVIAVILYFFFSGPVM